MPKVLISDQLSPAAVQIFKDRGVEVDVKTGLDRDELIKIIGDYDGLAIRSATKVTPPVLAAAKKLKVVGRAGIGVDAIPADSAVYQLHSDGPPYRQIVLRLVAGEVVHDVRGRWKSARPRRHRPSRQP